MSREYDALEEALAGDDPHAPIREALNSALPTATKEEADAAGSWSTQDYLRVQESVYGAEWKPIYDEGLGVTLTGKKSWLEAMAEKGVRHREPGEPRHGKRRDWHKKNRRRLDPHPFHSY